MRPRHFASENLPGMRAVEAGSQGFNEAEAFCLGKPT